MDLYSEIILDHYKNPKNFGHLEKPSHQADEFNQTCGDKIHIEILTTKDLQIDQIAFSGEGCAISQAATSMLTEEIKGLSIEEILKLDHKFINQMLNVEISPGRIKCATIGLEAIKKALRKTENTTQT